MDRETGERMVAGSAMLAALLSCGPREDDRSTFWDTIALPGPPAEATAETPAVRPLPAEVRAVESAGLLPPGSRILPAGKVEGAIAFAYRTADAPAAVNRWYRGAQRPGNFSLLSEMDEGGELVLTGTTARPAGEFTVRLAAANGGGTTAMVLVTPRQ